MSGELETLQLKDQDVWGLADGDALDSLDKFVLLGAFVFVLAIQVLPAGEPLQGLLHTASAVDL